MDCGGNTAHSQCIFPGEMLCARGCEALICKKAERLLIITNLGVFSFRENFVKLSFSNLV